MTKRAATVKDATERNEKVVNRGMRDILALVRFDDHSLEDVAYAVSLARFCGAHLTVLRLPSVLNEYHFLRNAPSEVIAKVRNDDRQSVQDFRARVGALAVAEGVIVETRISDSFDATAWDKLGIYARHFDVTAVPMLPDDAVAARHFIVDLIAEYSGRAVLVRPRQLAAKAAFSRIMVVWDRSRAAARALDEALPLLTRAESVEVVAIQSDAAEQRETRMPEVMQHLRRHRISGEISKLDNSADVVSSLHKHAALMKADLIVMGAYGYSRFSESNDLVVTSGMLKELATPVLLAH